MYLCLCFFKLLLDFVDGVQFLKLFCLALLLEGLKFIFFPCQRVVQLRYCFLGLSFPLLIILQHFVGLNQILIDFVGLLLMLLSGRLELILPIFKFLVHHVDLLFDVVDGLLVEIFMKGLAKILALLLEECDCVLFGSKFVLPRLEIFVDL